MIAPQKAKSVEIGPQEGPQTDFLTTTANIALYGGAAGGGKSYALLLETLRHLNNPRFGAVIFRRTTTQVRNEGGLWDESASLFGQIKGMHPVESVLEWTASSGWRLKFAHLEHEKTVLDWQGAQVPFFGFDELTHFTQKQFFYMLSRNRSTSGVPGYIRATANPDADSWVRKLIDWWIGDDGYPIKERAGVIRWFIRREDLIIWGNTRQELLDRYGQDELPKSFTFIPSTVYDNKILLQKDPAYLANLRALSRVDRLRLLGGNWNVRATAGNFFKREWFKVVDFIPEGAEAIIRFWDKAATEPNAENPDPDYTAGVKLYKYPNGKWLIADIKREQLSPGKVEVLVENTASHDSVECTIGLFQDPGSAGVADVDTYINLLAGYNIEITKPTKDKETLAKPVSAQAEHGNIMVLRAPWNDAFFGEAENFPEGAHDDMIDGLSGGFNLLSLGGGSILDAC